MKKGGLADSPFFRTPPQVVAEPSVIPEKPPVPNPVPAAPNIKTKPKQRKKTTNRDDTTTPRHRDTTHDTTVSRHHDTIIEVVRKAVKEYGKEAATHRFTLTEKKAIADILYAYKRRNIKTSENEVARIAINFVIRDYEENGENSVLHQVIEALNT